MNWSKLYPLDEQFVPRPLVLPPVPAPEADEPTPRAIEATVEDSPAPEPPVTEPPEAPCEDVVEEAFQRGLGEGELRSQAHLEPVLQALQKAGARMAGLRETLYEQSHQEMVSLVMAICRKILHRELSLDPAVIGSTLREALRQALQAEEHHVHLHPDDLAEAERLRPELMRSIRGIQHLAMHPDGQIARGGCRVESTKGEVDATLEGQLAVIEEALRGQLPEDKSQKTEDRRQEI